MMSSETARSFMGGVPVAPLDVVEAVPVHPLYSIARSFRWLTNPGGDVDQF